MGRSVADVALLENVIAGAHPSDHASLRDPPLLPLDPEPPAGLRVGLAVTLGDFPMDSELEAATRAFGRALSSAGVKVEEIEVDLRRQDVLDAMMIHFGAIFGPSVAEVAEGREELLTPYAAHFDRLSAEALEKHGYYRGLQLEASIQAAVGDAIDRYDALVCPTLATTGWAAGDEYIDHGLVVDDVELDFYFEALLTPVFNIASRHPVLNVPSGRASNGVPIGVQIVGRTYDDPTPFRIAAAAERLLGWWSDPTWRPSLV
jgi:aspartyl-tRNA(Asn)/glutamyl-tRNA(Gln) amidotransferase subunit A